MKIFKKISDFHDVAHKGYVDNSIETAINNLDYIQVETLPVAGVDNLGKIYEYIGSTTANYTNGFFYKCVSDGESTPTYSWEEIPVQAQDDTKITHYSTMPTAEVDYEDEIVQYIGADDAVNGFVNGYFYKCVEVEGSDPAEYEWIPAPTQALGADTIVDVNSLPVSDIENVIYRTTDAVSGETSYFAGNATEVETEQLAKYEDIQFIQVDTMPTADSTTEGRIVEYIGATTSVAPIYTHGFFYECVSDGAVTPTYSWEEVNFGDGTPHWTGTRAEYEAIKDTLAVGTIVSITDDYDSGLEVVDVVEEDNMNPVTSNAVYDYVEKEKDCFIGTPTFESGVTGTCRYYWRRNECTVVLSGVNVPANWVFNANFITGLPRSATDLNITQYGVLYSLMNPETTPAPYIALTNIPANDTGLKADGDIGSMPGPVRVYGSFTYRTKDWYSA